MTSTTTWHAHNPGPWLAAAAGILLLVTIVAVLFVRRLATKPPASAPGHSAQTAARASVADDARSLPRKIWDSVLALFRPVNGPRGGLLTGYDYRVSTSKSIAYVWTAVVAWIVLTEVLIVLLGQPVELIQGAHGHVTKTVPDFFTWMHHVLDEATSNALYLVFLGGPYAAAVTAKVLVTNKVARGTLQKPDGVPNRPGDVVRNDAGAIDLVDFQYVLFNLIVAGAAAGAFIKNVAAGLPSLTDYLAILTGGSALTYTINKGATSNAPTLVSIDPQSARVGDRVTVYGNNLSAVANDPNAQPAVTVAGVTATVVAGSATSDQVTFLVPAPPAGTAWFAGDPQRVIVTTVARVTAQLDDEFRVVPDEPHAVRLDPAAIAVASATDYTNLTISMYGTFLGPPGATPDTSAAAQIQIVHRNGGDRTTVSAALGYKYELQFTLPSNFPVPDPAEAARLDLDVIADRGDKSTAPLPLSVELIQPPILDSPQRQELPSGADLGGRELTLTGKGLEKPTAARGAAIATTSSPLDVQLTVQGTGPVAATVVRTEGDTRIICALPSNVPPLGANETRSCQVTVKRGVVTSNTVSFDLHGSV